MRRLVPALVLALSLAGCGDDQQAVNTQAVADESDANAITPVNDVTAIDAATGEAANMAADVNYTLEELDNESADNSASDSSPNSVE